MPADAPSRPEGTGGPSGAAGRPAPGRPARESRRAALDRRRRRRVLYSLLAVAVVLLIGTVGFEGVLHDGWVAAFYFESMLATGQGPPVPLSSVPGELFAAAMAFLSVGTVVTTLLLNVGPWFARIWREGLELAERELRRAERELVGESGDPTPDPPPD